MWDLRTYAFGEDAKGEWTDTVADARREKKREEDTEWEDGREEAAELKVSMTTPPKYLQSYNPKKGRKWMMHRNDPKKGLQGRGVVIDDDDQESHFSERDSLT